MLLKYRLMMSVIEEEVGLKTGSMVVTTEEITCTTSITRITGLEELTFRSENCRVVKHHPYSAHINHYSPCISS